MRILKVEEMHCSACVDRITKALTEAELKFRVSLEEKTVCVDGGDQSVKTAIEELDDLGFATEEVK
ncbi:MAG: heavy-metal-associated domain-containing protein [Acetivibrio sp.]